jgi:hypothetical protein
MREDLILAKLSTEKETALKLYLKRRVLELKQNMQVIFEEKIIKWRAAYDARPAVETRTFPFENASNIVIPIIKIHTDTLKAQIMAAIFKTDPIVVAKVLGEFSTESDLLKEAYQEFMNYVCIEPTELDLYRVYGEGIPECIKYGTVTFKCPWEQKFRDFVVPGGDGSGDAKDFLTKTVYSGPRPEKLPFTGFYIPPMAKRLEDTDIKAHKRIMLKHEILERKFLGLWSKEAVETILKSPDRTGPTEEQREKEEPIGTKTTGSFGHEEWDIWECFIDYRATDDAYAPHMIVTYHEKSDTIARCVYDNSDSPWFVGMRMAHVDDSYHGVGYAEALFMFQEGASETYNGYRDNQTIANTRVWRADEDSKLHQGYRIYPSAVIPGKKDEIEALAHGDVSPINLDELKLLLDLAERCSGVSPPQQGMGAGTTTGKRGIYSAMGTLSLLQEGNSRKDLNVSDMRDGHTRLMRIVSRQYGVHGPGDKIHEKRLELFGKKAPLIEKALAMVVEGKMGIPLRASTASFNKEVEKQNDIMLSQIIARHYQMIATLLGNMQSIAVPPEVKQYMGEVIIASNVLMKKLLRNFGHEEVDRLIPDPFKGQPPPPPQQPPQQGGQPPQGQGAPPNGPQRPPGSQPPGSPQLPGGPTGPRIQ